MGSIILDRMTSGVSRAFRACAGVALCSTAALLAGCGAQNENYSARSPVDEESQSAGEGAVSASLAAYPPAPPEDVAIGVDTSQYEDTDPSAVTEFRPALERYGTWEDNSTYGTVWVPSPTVVGPDFVPYSTAGRWTYDDSWVWVSDYEWGWAPFHYGRWVHVPGRGWAWIPGRRYAGAWVAWAYGPTYVGWAPLGPSWYWYNGVAVGVHVWPTPYYVYCPHHAVFAPSLQAHVVHGPAAAPIAASTPRYIPAQPSVGGPSRIPATPTVNPGPSPTQLGHQLASVPKPPAGGGVAQARALATPDQAVRAGARAPASGSGFVAGGSSPRYAAAGSSAGFSGSNDNSGSSFSGRSAFVPSSAIGNGSNSSSSVARSASPDPWRLDPPQVERARIAAPTRIDPRPSYDGSRPQTAAPAYRSPSYSAPSPSMPSQSPSSAPYRAPAASAPVYRAPDSAPYRAPSQPSAPVYRAPSQPSAPVYRAPSQSSAPVYRAPAPAPVMRAPAPVSRPSTPAPAPARPSGAGRAVRR